MLIILGRWLHCILIFFVMSVEFRSPRWGEISGSFAFLHSSSVDTSQLVNSSCVLESFSGWESPEYFISTVFK